MFKEGKKVLKSIVEKKNRRKVEKNKSNVEDGVSVGHYRCVCCEMHVW